MSKWIFLACVLGFTGCASVSKLGGSVEQPTVTQAAVLPGSNCITPLQEGCWEIRVLNMANSPNHPLLRKLSQPPASADEHQFRVQKLAPAVWGEYQRGTIRPSGPRTFLVMVFGPPIPLSAMAAYRVNQASNQYKFDTTKVSLEDVTGRVPVPEAFVKGKKIGKPSQVFRIRADGTAPLGASIQIPWSAVTPNTYVLVCSEQGGLFYPPLQANGIAQGEWITPESLIALRDRGSKRGLMVFVSN